MCVDFSDDNEMAYLKPSMNIFYFAFLDHKYSTHICSDYVSNGFYWINPVMVDW